MRLETLMGHIVEGGPDECWLWTGPRNPARLDRPTIEGKNASRWLWILYHGEPPDGWHVEHTCENSQCVNLAHLDAVPAEVNYERLRRTHCAQGHELTDENRCDGGEYAPGKRRSKCRLCHNEREKLRARRRREERQAARKGGQ